jgi:hypothetical protein
VRPRRHRLLAACFVLTLPPASLHTFSAVSAPHPRELPASDRQGPRNALGQSILDGVWTNSSLTDLQRPDELKGPVPDLAQASEFERIQNDPAALDAQDAAEAAKAGKPTPVGQNQSEYSDANLKLARVRGKPRSSFLVEPADGKLPYTAAAKARIAARTKSANQDFDDPETRPMNEQCLGTIASGPPLGNPGFNAHFQIVQTPGAVAILSEMTHDVRTIHIGASRSDPTPPPVWMGHSVGHWDGATLVVETRGFYPLEFPRGGVLLSDKAEVTERFTRTGPDAILYAFNVVDPVNYTAPWRGEMELRSAPPDALKEYACHEGNYSLAGILAGARREEAEAQGRATAAGTQPAR